ncbi:MAG: hypothetical protein Q7V10_00890 [Methanobacteriaceae archaeon]|nr:hypothetical protein [Methanobacteriaceae archaeon]MDO9628029.1 hypothetical protein [Methanobacteriaceae archaeon]
MWLDELQFNPLNTLLNCSNPAIDYFTRRDLLEEKVAEVSSLWELPAPRKIINKQNDDGFWKYPG